MMPIDLDFERAIDRNRSVRPERYVWHISPLCHDLSIARSGLLISNRGAVCVHNRVRKWQRTYQANWEQDCLWDALEVVCALMPQEMETGDFFVRCIDARFASRFTFWRIDTHVVTTPWYIDPYMDQDRSTTGGAAWNYLVTLGSIPRKALVPFKLDLDSAIAGGPVVSMSDGVACCRNGDDMLSHLRVDRSLRAVLRLPFMDGRLSQAA